MNYAPFAGQFAGSLPAATMHHFTSAKFAQNITAASANGAQMGQVVGVLSGGESGVHYLRPVEGGAGFQALPHQPAQQQLITLPITVPGAKPGDPQQTLQIQLMNPNVSTHASQVTVHQPKYQMAHIPLQTFQQGEIGTVLTLAYAQQDGAEGVQIIGNAGLPEGLQVVAALQPQDVQMLAPNLSGAEHLVSGASKGQSPEASYAPYTIHINSLLPTQHVLNIDDIKKSANNNNNTFRIKQEGSVTEETSKSEEVEVVANIQGAQQWTVASPNADLAEYLRQLPGGAQLHQFLKFNNDTSNPKEDAEEEAVVEEVPKDKETQESTQQTEEVETEMPVKIKKKKKYKKKPPKPKKPKPGQVVIATALDGTMLYCCPECHNAYPEKELLEQHLLSHKIERRYICGICGAGLKRREHLERHKLGHNPDRPFVCSVCLKGFKRKEHLNLHFVIHSGAKTEICQECGKGFYRKDHLRKHTRAHASKRARDEIVAQNLHTQYQQTHQPQQAASPTTSTSNDVNRPGTSTTMSTIQPEITIHVPTSTASVPIHITLPQHLVSMANNGNQTTTETHNIKQEMEGMLLQQ